jgi:hypothetical protein
VTDAPDPYTATEEFADPAAYGWWRGTHPNGFVLAVSARKPPMLHRAGCDKVDRDRHSGALGARGSRQICAAAPAALRAWIAREAPGAGAVLERCPRCGP